MQKTYEENTNKINKYPIAYDRGLLKIVFALLIIGVLAVFSASAPRCMYAGINPLMYVAQHIIWLVLGLFGMNIFSKIDYKNFKKIAFSFAIFVIILLLVVKFTPLGISVNGAKRWIGFSFLRFQPSELAKISTIMLLSSYFSLKPDLLKQKMLKYLFPLVLMIGIIYKQPNLSMTIILLSIAFCMYFFSGKSLKWLKILFCASVIFAAFELIGITHVVSNHIEPYQLARIINWQHPEADIQGGGYNVYQSLIAVSTGGLFGNGYGMSKAKLGWLPEAHTDFIFSVISEEMGFVFSLLIIGLFLCILYKGILIACRCPDTYGKFMAAGITVSICLQAFFNISVATAFLPATGITLPFISYGGSSLLVSLCMVGILLNISKREVVRIR